jgi:hypothetical protein
MINNPTNEHESPNPHSPQLTHSPHSPNLKSPHSSTRHFTTTRPFATFTKPQNHRIRQLATIVTFTTNPKSAQLTNLPPNKHKPGDPEHVHVHETTPIKEPFNWRNKDKQTKTKTKTNETNKNKQKTPNKTSVNTLPHIQTPFTWQNSTQTNTNQ